MVDKNGVNGTDAADQIDERGVPLKNLQEEFARKLEKQKEEIDAQFATLMQKLDGMTRDDPAPQFQPGVSVNERDELVKISARPRGYVEDIVNPLREKAEALEKELQEQRKAVSTAQWERMEDRIARAEGKKDYRELPEEMTKSIRQEIINRGWQGNPASAMDAYDIIKARRDNLTASDPDRIKRINGQGEGAGRSNASRSSLQTISNAMVAELASSSPSNPDYKKNMETLDKVQKGLIKVEG